MANFMSMIPRTGMKGAVLGVNRALEASLIDLAATFKFLFGGDAYKGAKPVNPSKTDGSTCVPKPCSFIDSRIIRRGELIRSNKDLIHLFHHHFGLGQSTQFRAVTIQTMNYSRSSMLEAQMSNKNVAEAADNQGISQCSENNASMGKHQIGENVSRKDKINFLVRTLLDLDDSKEAVYSALDAWVAWEQNFPIASLKRVLQILEKEQQWHRVVQVIKWMLSKGQGATWGLMLN
ncbi:uncharacterized protein LOC110820196 [Carica papaya]|uniref:uncharacterized protein LOC110820196 n=1 Tax=Carica papaya TaxID=3649 RepID=UPI000B8C7CA2|nr:uncharacterized protein LOC110820196 [Carica papaya]